MPTELLNSNMQIADTLARKIGAATTQIENTPALESRQTNTQESSLSKAATKLPSPSFKDYPEYTFIAPAFLFAVAYTMAVFGVVKGGYAAAIIYIPFCIGLMLGVIEINTLLSNMVKIEDHS